MDREGKIDKLDIIFEKQFELQVKLGQVATPLGFRQEQIDKTVLCIIDELFELLRETNYKYWRKSKSINEDELKMEFIDVFKFVLNLGLLLGIDSEELFLLFNQKDKINHKRIDNE